MHMKYNNNNNNNDFTLIQLNQYSHVIPNDVD